MASCSSNTATEVPLKIKLTRCGVVTERRRVRLVDPRFEDLLQCVRQWACGEFSVRYHDSDDDEVTMDTEDEWRECVTLWQQGRHSAGAAADGHANTLRVSVELSPKARAQRVNGRRHAPSGAFAMHRARLLKLRQRQTRGDNAATLADTTQAVRASEEPSPNAPQAQHGGGKQFMPRGVLAMHRARLLKLRQQQECGDNATTLADNTQAVRASEEPRTDAPQEQHGGKQFMPRGVLAMHRARLLKLRQQQECGDNAATPADTTQALRVTGRRGMWWRRHAADADRATQGACAAEDGTQQLSEGQDGTRCEKAQPKATDAMGHTAEDTHEVTDLCATDEVAVCDVVPQENQVDEVVALPDEARAAAVSEPCEADGPAVQQLRAMGFEITDEVRALLAQNDGNVMTVLELLL